jgi:N6-adenosine-specific RNA methylase IME4
MNNYQVMPPLSADEQAALAHVRGRQLICLEDACRALAEARSIEDVDHLRDQAETMRHYYRQRDYGIAAINDAAEIKIRAERRLGELLAEMPKNLGGKSTTDTLSEVGIAHHESSRWQRIASVPVEVFESHIAKVRGQEEELTTAGVLRLAASLRQPEPAPDDIPFPDAKARCLVIDPPWPLQKIPRIVRPKQDVALDYPTMSLEDIEAKMKEAIATSIDPAGCHVYLWVTQRFLLAGLALFETLGIRYHCQMTWVKPTGFTPFSWMFNTEHVLFGRLGNLDLQRVGLKLSFEAPTDEHSAKPDVFYDRVLEASPGPRLEMFQRKPRPGFIGWGNEVVEEAS